MEFNAHNTALVLVDPQNDVLTEKGAAWGLLGASVTENNTVDNIERLLKAANKNNYEVFISPHYFYPTDNDWKLNGPLENEEFKIHAFARSNPLDMEGFASSGADWPDRFKTYINDGKTIIVSPHKVFGCQTNDLVLQLRKRKIGKIILAGMMANICIESHLRELLEQGFEVAVSRMPPQDLVTLRGAMVIKLHSSTISTWRTPCFRPMMLSLAYLIRLQIPKTIKGNYHDRISKTTSYRYTDKAIGNEGNI